jgi:hypothetical protein
MVAERLADAEQFNCLHRVLRLTTDTLRYSANGYLRQRVDSHERPYGRAIHEGPHRTVDRSKAARPESAKTRPSRSFQGASP